MNGGGNQFEPGQSGNPAGKAKGTRNRATLAMEALLDGEAEALTRTAIELAKGGDGPALKLCLDRLCPPRKDRPVRFTLPEIEGPADFPKATSALLRAVAAGELSPDEAGSVANLIEMHRRSVETHDFGQRIAALEAAQPHRS